MTNDPARVLIDRIMSHSCEPDHQWAEWSRSICNACHAEPEVTAALTALKTRLAAAMAEIDKLAPTVLELEDRIAALTTLEEHGEATRPEGQQTKPRSLWYDRAMRAEAEVAALTAERDALKGGTKT